MKANVLKYIHNVSRSLWENVIAIGSHVCFAMGGLNSQKSSVLAQDTSAVRIFQLWALDH